MMNIKIDKLIYGGYGLGRSESGKAFMVKKTAPGDVVEPEVIRDNKNFAECAIRTLVSRGDDRITPQCPHFAECGSCDYQHLNYQDQLAQKELIFAEVLARQGIQVKPEPIIPGSNQTEYYRNTVRYFVLHHPSGSISFAKHSSRNPARLIEIKSCLLQSEQANQTLAKLRETINASPDNSANLWQIKIRESKTTGEMMVELISQRERYSGIDTLARALKTFPEIVSFYESVAHDQDLIKANRYLIFGQTTITEQIGHFTFQISPGSFFQPNSYGIKTLYDVVKKYAAVTPKDIVLDLFCGTGTIGIYLSAMAKRVIGVDSVRDAIQDAKDNAKRNRVYNMDFMCFDAEDFLHRVEVAPSVIVVDPPRSGLAPNIIQYLDVLTRPNSHTLTLSDSHTRIIYVSCNPATFARDVKLFHEKGIELIKVQPVDMFPHSQHIECVGLLQRKKAAK